MSKISEKWYLRIKHSDAIARAVLLSGSTWYARAEALSLLKYRDLIRATEGREVRVELVVHMENMLDDNTYRIRLTGGGIEVLCFGIESVDSKLEGYYDSVDELPDWVKERLAVLMVLDSTPPTGELAGVGRRISAHVFWVYAPGTASSASTSA